VASCRASKRKGVPFSTPFPPLTFTSFTTPCWQVCDLVVASAAGMTASGGMTGASGAGRAVRCAATVAGAAAAVTGSGAVATVSARRTRLHDGLPHVELGTRIAAALIITHTVACTSFAGVAGTGRGAIPIAATVSPQSICGTCGATRGFAAARRWRERLPLAAVRVAAGGRRLLPVARGRRSRCRRGASSVLILASLGAGTACRRTIRLSAR
jgi:hypothetical protein